MKTKQRPNAITVISILIIISGILLVVIGIRRVDLEFLLIRMIQDDTILVAQAMIFVVVYSILAALGMGYLVMSNGLLKGNGWTWSVTRILLSMGIVIGIISIIFEITYSLLFDYLFGNVIVVAISAITLYYLYRPQVKSYLGKTSEAGTTEI